MSWRGRSGSSWGRLGMESKWEKVHLSDVANLTVGFVGTMAQHYVDNGVTFLRSTNIELQGQKAL